MISEVKIILDGINSMLEIAKWKNSKHKGIKIDTIQNETQRKK